MAEELITGAVTKKKLSDEYKALVRSAEVAKKQAELLSLPYITKNSSETKANA